MINITTESFAATLDELVKEKGEDYVYPEDWREAHGTCRYAVNGEPACIVGSALVKLGVPVTLFDTLQIEGDDASGALQTLKEAGHITYDGSVLRMAQEAQSIQDASNVFDNDNTWGTAVREAKTAVNLPH